MRAHIHSVCLHTVQVLVDDWGYGDVGFHREVPDPELPTETIDRLASDGVIFDRHFVYKFCTPTRSS